jgi:hypothetical protein
VSKFDIGDWVRVINYGHPQWNKYKMVKGKPQLVLGIFDVAPYLIGSIGKIIKIDRVQEIDHYMLEGIPRKTAWYYDDQLELV